MKNKIFLTSIFVILFANPALATQGEIVANASLNTLTANCSGDPLYFDGTERTYGTLTYTAQWTANKYDVIYNSGAHGTGSYTDTNGATYDLDYTAKTLAETGINVADGYTFVGWNTLENQTTGNWTGAIPWNIDGSLTLYAAYAPKTYNVDYFCTPGTKINDENVTLTSSVVFGGEYNFKVGSNTCERSGYTFNAWNCNGGAVSPTDTTNWTIADDVTCTATWTAKEYNIIFNPGQAGERIPGVATEQAATFGTEVTLNDNTFSIAGYDWTGWKSNYDIVAGTPSTTQTYTDGQTINVYNVPGNTTLTAQWTPKNYTVDYKCDENDTNASFSDTDVTYDAEFSYRTGSSNSCTKNGYTFNRWDCVESGTTNTVNHTDGQPWTIAHNVTCTAQWTPNQIRLLWKSDVDEEPNLDTEPKTCTYGTTGGINGIYQPEKTGYTFTGWKTTAYSEESID